MGVSVFGLFSFLFRLSVFPLKCTTWRSGMSGRVEVREPGVLLSSMLTFFALIVLNFTLNF